MKKEQRPFLPLLTAAQVEAVERANRKKGHIRDYYARSRQACVLLLCIVALSSAS